MTRFETIRPGSNRVRMVAQRHRIVYAPRNFGARAAISALIHPDETWKGELADRLERYVRELYAAIRQRESIVRAFISEARALPESIRSALQDFMLAKKARFVAALREVQQLGLVRKEVDVSVAADFIRDSIHSAMLRHTLYRTDPETVDAHLRGITDIFYRGIKAND